ncbi:MAG: hypothetical protein QF681_06530 [Vicinamibacterales bacterium]|jgi:hypothetical protein|nr:hypothetical protein [Vicinamibacterales bacterium]
MTDEQPDRLEPLRQLAEASDDARLLDQVMATVELLEKDTALLLDQAHIARDIASRTKAGDWVANTELVEIMEDADYFLRVYKQQREDIGRLKATLQDKQTRLKTSV